MNGAQHTQARLFKWSGGEGEALDAAPPARKKYSPGPASPCADDTDNECDDDGQYYDDDEFQRERLAISSMPFRNQEARVQYALGRMPEENDGGRFTGQAEDWRFLGELEPLVYSCRRFCSSLRQCVCCRQKLFLLRLGLLPC